MKKDVILRLICCVLTLGMIVGGLFTLSSCNKGKEDVGGSTESVDLDSNSADPDSEEARYRPENINYGDFEYKWLVRENEKGQALYAYLDDGTPTQVCDYALYCRQAVMEERHGVTTLLLNEGSAAPNKLMEACLTGQTDYCHGASLGARNWASLAAQGCLLDLNDLDELNLEASYWDQRIQKEFNINGHLFALEGEFNYLDDLQTYVVLYNDTVWERLGLDVKYNTPYQLAKDGKWTYEMMMSMIKDTSYELKSDDVMDQHDFWGFVSEKGVPYYFFLGSGNKYIVNKEGSVEFAAADSTVWQTNYDILSELIKMGVNSDIYIANRDYSGDYTGTDAHWQAASDIFFNNHALFRSTALGDTLKLLDMEDDYGILPIPNYTENQGEYYCWCLGNNFSIPSCVSDSGQAAQIIEMINYYSLYLGGDSLNYAFYDLLAFARLCRTPDDVNMLKLVFANKTYDVDYAVKFANVQDIVAEMVQKNEYTALYSSLASLKESADTIIKDFVIKVESNLPKAR